MLLHVSQAALQEALKERGLPFSTGSKRVLAQRLHVFIRSSGGVAVDSPSGAQQVVFMPPPTPPEDAQQAAEVAAREDAGEIRSSGEAGLEQPLSALEDYNSGKSKPRRSRKSGKGAQVCLVGHDNLPLLFEF